MYDIIANKALAQDCKEKGLTPLVLGEDVLLVQTDADIKNARHPILLATTNNRAILEGPINGAVHLEQEEKKDHLHYKKAGLDQVNAKILSKGGKALILSYASIKHAKHPEKILGRMKQNARLAKKFKVPLIIASFATKKEELPNPTDLQAFFRGIGIDAQQIKNSQKEFSKIVKAATLRQSKSYVAEGITKAKGI